MDKTGEWFWSMIMIIFMILLIVVVVLISTWGDLLYKKYFGPKYAEVNREIWENTPSRVHGATQEISRRYVEYQSADDTGQKAICSTLRTQYSNLNPEVIDDSRLRSFFTRCKYGE